MVRTLAASLLLLAPLAAQDAVLRIDAGRELHTVDPSLFGIFFEEINHAGEGGLYAELMQNRGFEAPLQDGRIPGWALRVFPDSDATMAIVREHPCRTEAPACLSLSIRRGAAGAVGEGHFGVPLRSDEDYLLRFDARHHLPQGAAIDVMLESEEGKVLARAQVELGDGAWHRHELTLRPGATAAHARLVLSTRGPGELALDTVSLFPARTFRGERFGLRRDLGELLAALKPAFVRFPGGCYVEGGDRLRDAFHWKQTLGDIAARPGHLNANWGYWSTCGLGFHEYLLLCEQLGAAPMYVANCGMSHKELVPLAELGSYVQDVLDAIEYANGAVDSTWGKRRAENGHPAPFGLRYVEIGNENGMFGGFGGTRAQYTERYRVFFDAIKRAHPEVLTIANTRLDAPMEIVDDHDYQSCAWFWQNEARYDKADRKGPKIYVGEYAVTQDPGLGNLRAALAESAYLTGLLRNSDIITMASYAPLFVHAQDRRWNPDLIVFDGLRSYGTPSYHAQALFAQNRPHSVLHTEVPEFRGEPGHGSIGLGTWNTRAEYADLRVEIDGKPVFASDFATGTEGWRFVDGAWSTVEGSLRQDRERENQWCWLDLPQLAHTADYVLRCRARKLSGAEGFLLMFHVQGAADWCWFNVGGWGNHEHAIERMSGGGKSSVGAHVAGSVETGRWYDLRVECKAGHIRTFVDDQPVHDVEDRGARDFAAIAGRADDGALVVFAVNGAEVERALKLEVQGVNATAFDVEGTELGSASLLDENTLENPLHVAPLALAARRVEAAPTWRFAPRSLTVLRLRAVR